MLPNSLILMANPRYALACALAAMLAAHAACAQTEVTLLSKDSAWTYSDRNAWPGNGWFMPDFDDSSWKVGRPYFVVSDPGRTPLAKGSEPHPTYYFRAEFQVPDSADVESMAYDIDYDDQYAAYLNGVLIDTSDRAVNWNNHQAKSAVLHNSLVDTNPSEPRRPTYSFKPADMALIKDGRNVLAVAIKQHGPSSSDAAFDLRLAGKYLSAEASAKNALVRILDALVYPLAAAAVLMLAYYAFFRRTGKPAAAGPQKPQDEPAPKHDDIGPRITESLVEAGPKSVVLVSSTSEREHEIPAAVLDGLVRHMGAGVVYISFSKPYGLLSAQMRDAGIPSDDVYFIDLTSMMAGNASARNQNVVYIENPSSLEEVSMRLGGMIDRVKSAGKCIVLDSISSLLIYNKDKIVKEFIHFMINKAKLEGLGCVILSTDKREAEELVKTLTPMVDKTLRF